MTETLTSETTATVDGATPQPESLRIPAGIEVLPSTPPETGFPLRVLITGTVPPIIARHEEVLRHRVMTLSRSTSHPDAFLVSSLHPPHVSDFVYGALMNPTPVEGAFYMHPVTADAATITGVDHGLHYVTQYRNGEWVIVLPVNSDNTLLWSGRTTGSDSPRLPYFRVKAPLAMIPDGWAYTPDNVTEVTDRTTQMILRGQESGAADAAPGLPEILRDHAEPGAEPNETPQTGVLYALALYSDSTAVEFAYPAGDGRNWYVSHDLSRAGGDTELRVNGRRMHRPMVTSTSASVWVRARTVTMDSLPYPGIASVDARLAGLRGTAAELTERWAEYEESLNEVADSNSWCPDFERILEPLEMKGRKGQRTGTVRFTIAWSGEWEHTGISSSQDGLIGEALNFQVPGRVSIDSMSVTLSGVVEIIRYDVPLDSDGDPVDADGNDDPYGIDADDVANAITRLTGGTVNIDDFHIEDSYVETVND